jgi:putative nucleotidyltransferase with HDIG domain
LLAVRALHTVLLTRRRADLAVFIGLVWLAGALVPALMLSYLDLAWWLGHGLEVAGVLLVGAPVAADLFRSAPSRPLAGDLSGAELVSAEEAFLGSQVGGLMRLLAAKDEYTEGHTRRVALLAVAVGEELGLPPARLRELATGGLIHDIGKLSVPDEVLQKPGALDDEEYALVQRHAVWGDSLAGRLGFSARVRLLVRDHHERLDGSGYPNGTTSLSLETRVLAVCDVYDALRSQRVYREAWSHERAFGLLRDEADTGFDARCVDALERVLTAQTGTAAEIAVAV